MGNCASISVLNIILDLSIPGSVANDDDDFEFKLIGVTLSLEDDGAVDFIFS